MVYWTENGNASHYVIYLHDVFNGTWEILGNTSDMQYDVENLAPVSLYGIIIESHLNGFQVGNTTVYDSTCDHGISIVITNITDTSFTATWPAIPNVEYVVWHNGPSAYECGGYTRTSQSSYEANGLRPGTAYNLAVYVLYPLTTVTHVQIITTTGSPVATTGSVSNFNWNQPDPTQLFVEWTGSAMEYGLYVNGPSGLVGTEHAADTDYTISNLNTGTYYDLTIIATNASGVISEHTYCLSTDAGTTELKLHVTSLQSTTVAVQWDEIPGARGYIIVAYDPDIYYPHYYGCGGCSYLDFICYYYGYGHPVAITYEAAPATSSKLRGLHPDNNYTLMIRPVHETGHSYASLPVPVTTPSHDYTTTTDAATLNSVPPTIKSFDAERGMEKLQSLLDQPQISEDELEDVVETVSSLTQYFKEPPDGEKVTVEETQAVLQSLSTLARRINFGTNSTSANGSAIFVAKTDNLVLEVRDQSTRELTGPETFDFTPTLDGVQGPPVKISVPAQGIAGFPIIDGVNSDTVRAVFLLHRDSTLFPSEKTTNWVISAEFGDKNRTYDDLQFQEPVVIEYFQPEDIELKDSSGLKKNISEMECVFWDFKLFSWSRMGCCLVPGDVPSCHCDHLTNFALLVKIREIPTDFRLPLISGIGCILSIFGLSATFIIILSVRKIRHRRQMQVVLHLCFNLTVAYCVLLFGIYQTRDESVCSAMAATLHFFFLCSWAWMAVYGHIIYKSLVEVLENIGRLYNIKRAMLFAYGVPAVIVALNAGITLGYLDQSKESLTCEGGGDFQQSHYNYRHVCWLKDYSLYFGFLLPVGLLLIFNISIFLIVVPKITCCREQIQSTAQRRTVKQHLEVAAVMAILLGLSWATGYIMMVSDDEVYLAVFSWIFAVINSLQGFCIFLVLVVRRGEVRNGFLAMMKERFQLLTAGRNISPRDFTDFNVDGIPRRPVVRCIDIPTASTNLGYEEVSSYL